MCDFFFLYSPRIRIFNVPFSSDERGSSCLDDETSDAVIKILWFHM